MVDDAVIAYWLVVDVTVQIGASFAFADAHND